MKDVTTALMPEALKAFFAVRAAVVAEGNVDFNAHCYVSGRDPRLWAMPNLYGEYINSIAEQANILPEHKILEAGCATGFLAKGLSALSRSYTGVDIAEEPVAVARAQNLADATFLCQDATALAFPDNSFDRAVCCNVFINLPDFALGQAIIKELLRVVVPGGRVMIGDLPDADCKEKADAITQELRDALAEKFGPFENYIPSEDREGDSPTARNLRAEGITPSVRCYAYGKSQFEALGKALGVKTKFFDIHAGNPYFSTRFNVVYTKNL